MAGDAGSRLLAQYESASLPSQGNGERQMEPGRLIWVRKYLGDPASVAYAVALSESAPAKTVIQDRLGISPEYIADIGSVSTPLMAAPA